MHDIETTLELYNHINVHKLYTKRKLSKVNSANCCCVTNLELFHFQPSANICLIFAFITQHKAHKDGYSRIA